MARYDYKTLARDPAKQQEVLRFCDAFEQFMADNSFPADEREKYQEVFGDLRETAQGNTVGHNVLLDQKETIAPLLNDFDNMVDFVRGRMVHLDSANHDLFERMKQSVPGAEQFLQGIEMPERGTAGYNFDQSRDFLMFSGTYSAPHERSMDGQTAQMHIATAFALREATQGARDWRKVKIDGEKLAQRRTEIDHSIDHGSGALGELLGNSEKGAMDLYPPLYCAEPSDLVDTINERYCSDILPASVREVQGIGATMRDMRREEINEGNLVEIALPTMVSAAIAASDPRKYKTFQSVEQQERKYRHLYEGFAKGKSAQELHALLTGDGAQTLSAIHAYAPPAKERIEALQQKLKTSRDAAEKQRLTAEIIANRELVGAKRGGAGLDGRPDPKAVEARTAELAAEMSKVYANDPRGLNKLISQATSGHGGKMLDNYNQAAQPERAAQREAAWKEKAPKQYKSGVAVGMVQSMHENGKAAKALDDMIRGMRRAARSDEDVRNVLDKATEFQSTCREALPAYQKDLTQTGAGTGPYMDTIRRWIYLGKAMDKLKETKPELHQRLCGAFDKTMRTTDFSKAHEIVEAREEKLKAQEAQEKAAEKQNEPVAKQIALHDGDAQVWEDSTTHVLDRIRDGILNDPAYQADHNSLNPVELAKIMYTVGVYSNPDFGPDKRLQPRHIASFDQYAQGIYDNHKEKFDKLARDPKVHEFLAQREPGKSWAASSCEKLQAYADKRLEAPTYADCIDKLNLEQPTDLDVAKLVTATALYIGEPDGAQAWADPQEIEKTAAAMAKQPAFQELMNDPATLQNAKMGLGVPLFEQLQAKQKQFEAQKQPEIQQPQSEPLEKQQEPQAAPVM